MRENEFDRKVNDRLASEPWFIARANGQTQSNPRHLSNCQDCYTKPDDHLENPPVWTAGELAELL